MTEPPFASPAAPPADNQPHRVLGPIDATCVVIGAVIGVGIFFTPTDVAKAAGSAELAMLAWALGGLIALCGALTFAELGARFNAAAAQYEVIRSAWGSFAAFLFVFCITTVIVPGAAAIMAIICTRYLGKAIGVDLEQLDTSALERAAASIGLTVEPGAFSSAPLLGISAALVIFLMVANDIGARWGAAIQNLTVYAKVAALLAITGIAAFWGSSAAHVAPAPETAEAATAGLGPVAGVLAALVSAFFSYGGWQQALWVSGEVRNPKRTIPRAIIGGTVLVIIIYLIVNWAYFRLLGETGVMTSKTLASDAVATIAPAWGAQLTAAAVAISAFGILNVQFLTQPRLTCAMSRDGRFFRFFGTLNRRGTPGPAIALLALATLLLTFIAGEDGVNKLLTGTTFVDGVFFIMTAAALFVFRGRQSRETQQQNRAHSHDGFRVPLYPWVPLFFILGEIGMLTGAYLNAEVRIASIIGAIWIVVGAIVYALWFRRGESGANPS